MPRRSVFRLFIAVAMGSLATLVMTESAAAQNTLMTGELPDSIIVTANRYAEHVNLSGRRASVWNAAELERLPITGFDELLRTVAGVEVLSRGGFGIQSDISIRGSTFNGVLVLLDGLRLNDPMTGHFLMDLPVPMSEIARIEVIRGPAAAVYGPDALGGVIQILTHTYLHRFTSADTTSGRGIAVNSTANGDSDVHSISAGGIGIGSTIDDRVSIDAKATGGDHGLYGFNGAVRSRSSIRHVSLAAATARADGPQIRGDLGRPVAGAAGPVRSDFRRNVQTAAVAQKIGRNRFIARAGRDQRAFSAYHYYTPFVSDTAREQTSTLWVHGGLDGERGATRWRIHGGLKQHDDGYVYNPITPANEHRSRLGQIHGFAVRHVSPVLLMTGGAGASWRSIDSNNLGRHADAAAGTFYSIRWRPRPTVSLTGSARFDYDGGFGIAFTPQMSIVWYDGSFGLHALAGRSVRSPNYVERFFNTTLAQPRGRSVGNPDLAPERAWSYETGATFYPTDGVAVHATGFLRFTGNLIDYARLTPADTIFLARNLHDVRTAGLELDASLRRRFGRTQLRVDAAYTFLDADLGALDADVEYKYVLTSARHVGQWAMTCSIGKAFGGMQVLHRRPLEGDPYTVVHAGTGYGIDTGTGAVQISAEVRNVFDRRYSEVFDAPAPPRWWLLNLRFVL